MQDPVARAYEFLSVEEREHQNANLRALCRFLEETNEKDVTMEMIAPYIEEQGTGGEGDTLTLTLTQPLVSTVA